MSKSKYEKEVCPYCEKPLADYALVEKWRHKWEAAGKNDDAPALKTWEDQYCWVGWDHQDVSIDDRLVEVLEQRDALRAALEAVEWARESMPGRDDFCPWCGACQYDGHKPDCQRQAALSKSRTA